MKYTTKAQMEMIGLAVIVILLALGMFFVTKFTLTKQQTSSVVSFQQKQIGASFVNTLITANSKCGSATYTDLILDLADPDRSTLTCPEGPLYQHLNLTIRNILNKTIDKWNYRYEINITYPLRAENARDFGLNKGCTAQSQVETYTQPLPSDFGPILVKMRLCY